MDSTGHSDPDFVQRRLSEIFRDAAARSTGAAKPRFQRLSKAYETFVEAGNSGSDADFEIARAQFAAARADLESYVRTDSAARRLFLSMSADVARVTEGYDDVPAPPHTVHPRRPAGNHFSI